MGVTVMSIKLLGSLLLLCAGVWSSFMLARYERMRVSVLDGYMALIRLIRDEIDCFAKPLDRILDEADPAVVSACVGRGGHRHVPVVRDLGYMIRSSRAYLGAEAERLLHGFSEGIGKGFREGEVKRCDECLDALGEQRGRLFDSLPARLRTGCTLCVTVSLSAALLLW